MVFSSEVFFLRILAVSDIHGSDKGVRRVHDWIDELKPELLLLCGDITHFGPVSFAEEFIEGLDVKTLAIPGNCDPEAIVELLDELEVNLHQKKVRIGDETFVGFGGSDPTPFGTLFEVPDDQIYESLRPLMEEDCVLVTHAPPYGTLDNIPSVGHFGSRSVKRIIEQFRPKLAVFGHIHEARGVRAGETTYLNPGETREGCAAFVSIDDSVEVDLLG